MSRKTKIVIHLPHGIDIEREGVDYWRYVGEILIVVYLDGRQESFNGGIVGVR